MKKRLLILSVCLLSLTDLLFGQTDYKEGYIITLKHDTIFGTINNRSYYDNSQQCEFRFPNSDSTVSYTPDILFGYRFKNGKYYISKEINGHTVFMEYLIKGRLNIYFNEDATGTNNYFAASDSLPLSELKYHSEIKEIDGKQILIEAKDYMHILTYYTADCPVIAKKIQGMNKPDHRNLIKLVREYQALTCKDEECIVYEKKVKSQFKVSFYGGSDFAFKTNPLYPHFPNYSLWGVNVLMRQSQKNERIYLGLGFFDEGIIADSPDKFYHTQYWHANGRIYRVPFSINYLHPKKGFSPTLSYQFNLTRLVLQNLDFGLMYRVGNAAISLTADLKTQVIVRPYGAGLLMGMTFDL